MKLLKKFLTIICFLISLLPNTGYTQCNINVSTCSLGSTASFPFVSPGPYVSTCLDFFGPSYGYVILYITQTGKLNLLIDGNASSGFLDVAVFNIPNGIVPCNAIKNTANQISCNYASGSSGCVQLGAIFPCSSSRPAPDVTAGQTIMIVVENWSGTSSSFTFQIGSTPESAKAGTPNGTINPVSPLCIGKAPVQVTAANMGGTWSGPGISSSGLFNPSLAGIGTHTINYTIGTEPCVSNTSTNITVITVDTGRLDKVICLGETYTFAGNTYDTTVLATDSILGTFQTSSGCDSMVLFTLAINPIPTVVGANNQILCHGEPATEVMFSGAVPGTVYTWSNNTPNIGLAANGTGNIPSFNAVNNTSTAVTAIVAVKPSYANGGITCYGIPDTITYTVNDTFITNLSQTVYDYELPIIFGSQSLNAAGTYTEVFTAESGCDSTVHLDLTVINTFDIAGKVHNDVNGMNGNPSVINGNGTNAGGLKAVLIDAVADTVVAYNTVASNGNFSFENIISNNYKIIITNEDIIGNAVPAITLAVGWVHTGEKLGSGNGNDGIADGLLELGVINQNISVSFGIQPPPVASNSSVASQLNPGSNASVNLPNSTFSMSDPSPGAVAKVRFTAFPSGTDNVYINGNSYNSGNWPGTLEVNAQYLFGNLLMPNVSIDPTTGPQQAMITYQAIDAAGAASNTATITMPFTGIIIGGTVHNNFQGTNGSPVNTIAGPGTNGGGLYAILSEDISNKVVATQTVNGSTGAYQFTGIDKGYYTVRLSTADVLPGSIAPAPGINPGWKATAEKNGTGSGSDGFADSKVALGLQAANNNNVHFGIQQPPTASGATAASQLNPNGNISYIVPAATFLTMDAAPGAVTSLYFNGALPANANKLVLNGITYSATNPLPPTGVHVVLSSGSPVNPILVDPVNGNVTVAISYNAVDAAGMMSATAITSQPFHNTSAMAGNNNSSGKGANPVSSEGQGMATFKAINISIYPNPTKDRVFIKTNDLSHIKALRLLDIQGRELRFTHQPIANGMDMNGITPGTYLLQVELQTGNSQRFKVVKE